jgi:hypothetical protein
MDKVRVKRDELLTTIRVNRDAHRGEFLKALEGYKKAWEEELERNLADLRAGRKFKRALSLAEPEDHTADYDAVIKMLEMSVDDIVEMPLHQFQMYVMDQWEWKHRTSLTNTVYAAMAEPT